MTETLEYQKTYGLLWDEVYEQMEKSPEQIADFIAENTESFWGYSPTKTEQEMRNALYEAQQFYTYKTGLTNGLEGLKTEFSEDAIKISAAIETLGSKVDTYLTTAGGSGGSSGSGGSGGSSGGGSGGSGGSSGGKTQLGIGYRSNNQWTH
jgi:uncharacterized membrane protein YgcG